MLDKILLIVTLFVPLMQQYDLIMKKCFSMCIKFLYEIYMKVPSDPI